MNRFTLTIALATAVAGALSACSAMPSAPTVDNKALPEAVRAPSDARFMFLTTGVGELTYECRARSDDASQFAWAFVAPVATLYGKDRQVLGKYYAGPTWEHKDGSRITGKQVAVSPATPGSIPLQLVKADAPVGAGALQGVTHIQRLNTQGGVAPQTACGSANAGARQQVAYQADYAFYGR
jgi:Protein of unknown function (DUF3455)